MARILGIAAAVMLSPALAFAGLDPSTPTANTTSGLIIGHAAPNRSEVTEFLGIRYAEPPVGDLRFAPPKRYNAPTGTVYNALDWSPDCLSNKPPVSPFPNFSEPSGFRVWNMFAAQTGNPSSEDCLSLNIWTKTPHNSAKKPVLIWFHGGRQLLQNQALPRLLCMLIATGRLPNTWPTQSILQWPVPVSGRGRRCCDTKLSSWNIWFLRCAGFATERSPAGPSLCRGVGPRQHCKQLLMQSWPSRDESPSISGCSPSVCSTAGFGKGHHGHTA